MAVEGLLRLFDILDTDGNGSISQAELYRELRLFGFTKDQIEHFRSALDLNGDDEITLDEYKIALGIPYEVPEIIKISAPQLAKNIELMSVFSKADKNRDGMISKDELFLLLGQSGMSCTEVENLFSSLDLNNDGIITLGEYKVALGIDEETVDVWKHLFRELDQDNSGEVTAQELYQIFKNSESNVTLQTIEQWIADYDQDGDGKLNYQEFMTYVGRQAEQSFP
ncbi:hypothetical protein FBUS_05258 [Fasciolopsis buskii]|uniref:EF-hand domain-containing protein n=1 Tax=Fasciolopsis buskii TaxID=27845 RepID=A0A8E0VGL9_9TREM|nr:hypothetical protein FBUS_05258 [Fasciolopsis buski]